MPARPLTAPSPAAAALDAAPLVAAPRVSPLRPDVAELPFAVARLTADGTILRAGRGVALATGYDEEALLEPAFWLRVLHPEDRHAFTAALRDAGARSRAAVRLRVRRADGVLRVAEVQLRTADAPGELDALLLDVTDRDAAAAALFHREAVYESFLEQSPLGVIHLDAEGVVTFENHRVRAILGAVEGDLLGRRLLDAPGFDARLAPALRRLLRDGESLDDLDLTFAAPDGTRRHLRAFGAPITEPEAGLVGAALMLLDATDDRSRAEAMRVRARYDQAEPALRNAALSSADDLTLLEAAVAVIGPTAGAARVRALLAGPDGVLVPVATWSATPHDVPEPVELDPAAWPALAAGRVALVTAGAAGPAAQTLLRAAGCTTALLVPFRDEAARAGAFLLERDDDTGGWDRAEHDALARLAHLFETLWAWSRAEARYRLTLADLDDGLFNLTHGDDGRRRYLLVTPQLERITGYPAARLLGTEDEATDPVAAPDAGRLDWLDDLVHPDDRELAAAHDAALRAGEPSRCTYRLRCADGEVRYVRESATPSRSALGQPVVGGLVSDVTEAKRAEASLLQAKLAAERASRTKTQFLAMISHEIRSPLGAIHGFADLLVQEVAELEAARGEALPGPFAEFSGILVEKSREVLRLVHDLFDLSRLETGALALRSVPVDLHPIVDRVVERYTEAAAEKGLSLTFERADGEPVLLADPDRVEQVVDQLVSNAVKFTEAGHVTVRTALDGPAARLAVEDTGIGMSPAYVEGLFEPFSQEDYRLNRAYAGSGLGLAIVKRLVDGMGGAIAVESEKGVGSRFEVRFGPAEA